MTIPHPPDDPLAAGDAWNEQDHPRDKNGRFGSGGGSGEEKKSSAVGYTDSRGNARSPGLSKSERSVESRFYNAVDKKAPELIEKYHKMVGNLIDPDKVKLLSPAFAKNLDLAAAVHEPSSKLAKMIYTDALQRKKDAGDKSPTVFLAGGSGSGKSTTKSGALAALGADPDGLIYDSVLGNPDSAKSRIDLALKMTDGPVGIAYTNADIKQALIQNAKRDRAVSIDTLMHAHVGASNTIRQLAEHYKDNPRVKIQVMNNLGKIEDAAPGKLGDVPKYQPQELRRQLVDVAKKLLDEGDIEQKRFDLLTK